MDKSRFHVFVSGSVQGVGFRYYIQRAALRLGVKGWIRNLSDGRVEAVLEGDDTPVKELLKMCGKGPYLAEVDEVKATNEPYRGEFYTFTAK